jgi:UDP-2-acetamido-2,6-beta-L-arabino-hexul-4-ose reductase
VAELTRVFVTGAAGFVGRNLTTTLGRTDGIDTLGHDLGSDPAVLEEALATAEVIFHLAGVNRPQDPTEFEAGNAGFTEEIIARLKAVGRAPKIVLSSSIQAERDNPYGVSKRRAEEALEGYAERTGASVSIYRLPNLFGKWCRPNYNSVVATFCHHIARDEPITISDESHELELAYIDDVVAAFVSEVTEDREPGVHWGTVQPTHRITLGCLAETLRGFRESRSTLWVPDFASDPLTRCLYATYLSYLPDGEQVYALEQRSDPRGSLAEFVKSPPFGQVFVSYTEPGITRGNHYHDTKTEKFLVVAGEGLIRMRRIDSDEIIKFRVRGEEYRVVDIPPGYTHSIENVGEGRMVTLFWACEVFDPSSADTHYCEVLRDL